MYWYTLLHYLMPDMRKCVVLVLLDALEKSNNKWPVIVIDETNMLMGWDKYPADPFCQPSLPPT